MRKSTEFDKDFLLNLIDLAQMVSDLDSDTIHFTLAEVAGIRMDVSISFSYTSIDKEEIKYVKH